MKILMVLTTHDELGISGKTNGLWLEEFAAPYYVFKDSGATVTLASPKGGHPLLDPESVRIENRTNATERFNSDGNARTVLSRTIKLSDVSVDDFDVLFYPGAQDSFCDLAEVTSAIALLVALSAKGKAAVSGGHGARNYYQTRYADGLSLNSTTVGAVSAGVERMGTRAPSDLSFQVKNELLQKRRSFFKGFSWPTVFGT